MEKEKTMDKDGTEEKRKKPIRLGAIIIILLVLAGGIIGIVWLMDSLNYVSTDNASIDGEHTNISARMLGRIKTINTAEGDKVNEGQILVILDDADLKAQEKQVAAALNSARQNLSLSGINLERAERDYKRVKTLYGSNAATKEQFDHAQTALDTANAQHAIAQAQVEAARAQLGVVQTQLLNTQVLSPIPGTVAKVNLHPGDIAQPGLTILTINNLDVVWINANFEETKINRIKPDAAVEITVDAYPGLVLEGRVERISAGIVPPPFSIGEFTKTTQRIPVKIVFIDLPDSLRLLPGMSVEVKVKT